MKMEQFKLKDYEEAKTRIKTYIDSSDDGKIDLSDLLLSSYDILEIIKDNYDSFYSFSEIDTNGWQMDFWITVRINNEKYTVQGGGVYRTLALFKGE